MTESRQSLRKPFENHAVEGRNRVPEKVLRHAKKTSRIIIQAALATSLALEMAHIATRYKVTEREITNGTVYTHEDARTTNILNYISGKSKLPELERQKIYRHLVHDELQRYSPELIPENFNTLTSLELRDLAMKSLGTYLPEKNKKELQNMADSWLEPFASDFQSHPKTYEILWKIENKVGAPKIRWNFEAPIIKAASGQDAFYDPLSNTIYISDKFPDILGEVVHADQWDKQPLRSSGRFAYSWLRVLARSAVEWQSVDQSYGAEYELPGSIEYEAHRKKERAAANEIMELTGMIGRTIELHEESIKQ